MRAGWAMIWRAMAAFGLGLMVLSGGAARAEDAASQNTTDIPVMHEEAAAAGLNSDYDGSFNFYSGGGGAAFDCNGSGYPSVFLAGGKNRAKFYVNVSKRGGPLKFVEKRLHIQTDRKELHKVIGAYPLDIDGDGHMDLVVLRLGRTLLLKGGKDCTFTIANKLWHFDGDAGWDTAFSAIWEPGQTFPTLAIGHYIDRFAPGSPFGTCEDNSLFRPGPGSTPDYSKRTVLRPGWCALSMLFTDWDRSGHPALRISNDRQYYRGGEEQMWKILPGQPPKLYGRNDGWRHFSIFGMGIAQGYLDNTGFPEYALTSMGDTMLMQLERSAARDDKPVYRNIAGDVGATAHQPYTGGDPRPSTGWHSEFADFNNDSLADLYISKGNVAQMQDFASYDPSNLLLGQWNGKFVEAGKQAGIADKRQARGALITDFNLDGNLDILAINRQRNVSLFRNLGALQKHGPPIPMGNYIEIRLRQPNPNRNAVGAKIAVKIGRRTLYRSVDVGGGDASGHCCWVHVGLGVAERAEIRVHWPGGGWSYPYRVFANQFVVIDRQSPKAQYWYPAH